MIVVGLTGSLAMGKSTAAAMFAEAGIPVCDADAVVHALYAPGGAAVEPVAALFPGALRGGAIDRGLLSDMLADRPQDFAKLEAIVHPLVRRAQDAFIARCRQAREALVVLDIPLLFETGRDRDVNKIVVVSAQPEVQRARAMARPGMTEEKLALLLAHQLPDEEKRQRADFVVETHKGMDHARAQIGAIIRSLTPNQRS